MTARAEAEAVADHIKRTWDELRIEALRERLRTWLRWYREDYPGLIAAGRSATRRSTSADRSA